VRKEDHLLQHLQNPAFRDEPSRLAWPGASGRLTIMPCTFSGGMDAVAKFVNGSAGWRVSWFPDANIGIRDDATPVWDALRLAALGSNMGSTVISGVVEHELAEWFRDPWHHKDRARQISDGLNGETWVRRFDLGPDSPLYPAIVGYASLLGIRRCLVRPCSDGLTLVDTDPTAKSETMNAIRNKIGARAESLARKGRIDAEQNGSINVNDELHCMLAICYALLTETESMILTADEDLTEVFFKSQWFLDTHYRAWLAAGLVRNGVYGKPVNELDTTDGFFDGPLVLFRRQTPHLLEVLPRRYTPIRVTLVYVSPDGTVRTLSFPFEREMLLMLEMRARTRGRCTDLFGEANIHVDLGPIKRRLDGLYLGIGRDAGDLVELDGAKMFLARLDQVQSLNCAERWA
jgi:hypothetical protein